MTNVKLIYFILLFPVIGLAAMVGCKSAHSDKAHQTTSQTAPASKLTSFVASRPSTAPLATTAPSARLDVKVAETAILGEPVLMEVTVTNTGCAAMSYWCGGPDTYPNAEIFRVTLTDADGKMLEVQPSNGQYIQGSGGHCRIIPGQSIQVPLAIPPLAAGKWTLQVNCIEGGYIDKKAGGVKHVTWPMVDKTSGSAFTVKDDAEAKQQFEKELLARIRGGKDVFSRHVASHYAIMGVLTPLLRDLSGPDDKAALTAENTLFQTPSLPPGTDKVVREAVAAQLKRDEYKADVNLLACLMGLAERQPTDEMLKAVLALAHSDIKSPGDEILDHAVSALRYFPQKESQDELHRFLNDKRQRVRDAASNALAHPWPPNNSVPASSDARP